MATCAQEVVVTDNGNGSYTLANNNAVPMTVTVTTSPVPSWSPLTIVANSSETVSVTHPGGDDTFCWNLSTDCDESTTGDKIVSATAGDGPYVSGDVIEHILTVQNTGTETLTITINAHGSTMGPYTAQPGQTVSDQFDYTVTDSDVGVGDVTCIFQFNCAGPSGTIVQSDTVTSTVANDSTDPVLICPDSDFVLTSPIYTMMWTHNPPVNTVVNYDKRINGVVDPGPSVTYPATSCDVNIASIVGSSGSGQFKAKLLYWYDGDLTPPLAETNECCINYDFGAGIGGEVPGITCDPARLAAADEYADLFFAHFQAFKDDIEIFGFNKTDLQWFQDSSSQYGGRTGGRMYQFKDWIESITRMMLLAHAQGQTVRAQLYKDCLQDILDDLVPKFIAGDGTGVATSGNANNPNWNCNSDYYPCSTGSPPVTRHRFLDATRMMAWSGYAMCSMQQCGTTAAQDAQFESWAQQIQPAVAKFIDNSTTHCAPSNGGFSHMCTHPIVAACYMGKLGGYLGTYSGTINSSLNTALNGYANSNGDLGSDLGHDTASISNLMMLRDKQLAGNGAGPLVTKSILTTIANRTAARISAGASWGSTAQAATGNAGWIHMHALGIGVSNAIDNLVDPPTTANYPAIVSGSIHTGSNQMVTLASAAYGLACRDDGEVC